MIHTTVLPVKTTWFWNCMSFGSSHNYPVSKEPLSLLVSRSSQAWQTAGELKLWFFFVLFCFFINTFNEILISTRHDTTQGKLLGFSQEENDVLAPWRGVLKATHKLSDLQTSHSSSHCSALILYEERKETQAVYYENVFGCEQLFK